MAAKAQQPGDDHLRTAARPRLADGLAHHLEAGGQVGAIHGMPFDPVAGRLVHERATGELPLGRSGVGVMVVGDNQHQRQFLHRGLVHGFMKGAGGSCAVADAGGADRAR